MSRSPGVYVSLTLPERYEDRLPDRQALSRFESAPINRATLNEAMGMLNQLLMVDAHERVYELHREQAKGYLRNIIAQCRSKGLS